MNYKGIVYDLHLDQGLRCIGNLILEPVRQGGVNLIDEDPPQVWIGMDENHLVGDIGQEDLVLFPS